jgi:hypothetical protein
MYRTIMVVALLAVGCAGQVAAPVSSACNEKLQAELATIAVCGEATITVEVAGETCSAPCQVSPTVVCGLIGFPGYTWVPEGSGICANPAQSAAAVYTYGGVNGNCCGGIS